MRTRLLLSYLCGMIGGIGCFLIGMFVGKGFIPSIIFCTVGVGLMQLAVISDIIGIMIKRGKIQE